MFFCGYCFVLCSLHAAGQDYPFRNPALPAAERANDLLDRLTLEEKASLMQNESPAIERLGIKAYDWWNEALHGVARAGLATVYPQAIGMAASFDDRLLFDVFTSVSDEARAKSNEFSKSGKLKRYQGLTMWTPNVNIFRDPRWGRGQETYGEDPYLSSRMGVAVVNGLQGPSDAEYDKLHACAKHFAVHSGPEWNRHSFNAENIAPRDLWETYLPAFKALVQEADVKEVMCAYNRYEGQPCCGSNRLLHQILREEWGFDGIVVSDCWAINDFWEKGRHETHATREHATAGAIATGTDLECGSNYASIPEAVKAGLIDESKVDISLKRLLEARFRLGEMDDNVCWDTIPYSVVDCERHRDLALQMARESIVLLQNKGGILPLDGHEKVAVMGPNANDSTMQWGNYNGFPSHTVTLLEAMKEVFPDGQIIYEPGCDHTEDSALTSLFEACRFEGVRGFKATYWNNPRMEGTPAAVTRVSTPFRFITTGGTTFASGVNIRNFSAVYESVFTAPADQKVDFCFGARAEVRLYVNDELVAQRRFIRGNDNLYTLDAHVGKDYKIKIEYIFDRSAGEASLDFDLGYYTPVNFAKSLERVKDADVVVFAGGISPALEGEEMAVSIPGFKGGDRTSIELPGVQRRLLKELHAAGKKIILVNFSGSAIALEPETASCDAILQAWYPGQAGGTALAEVLTGRYNPAGRLPVTFYRNTEQLPDFEDYSMKGRTYRYMNESPLFPFGHGLSYTAFEYGTATLSHTALSDNGQTELAIPLTNTGDMDGDEVVQVYLARPDDREGPSHTLRAFRRVNVKKGETVTVRFMLDSKDFEWFDTATNTMRPIEGQYELWYGGTSDKGKLKKAQIKIL